MRYELALTSSGPLGFAEHAAGAGQTLAVRIQGFFTPDDRDVFYTRIEQIQEIFLGPYFSAGAAPASISHFLVVVENNRAQIYVNEPPIALRMVSRRAIRAGEPILKKDIGGIDTARFAGVEISPKSAVIFYFTLGWRRGLFFDLRPLHGEPLTELNRDLGACYDYLFFSDLHTIPSSRWPVIFGAGWFPFMRLIGGAFEPIIAFLDRDILPAWEETVFAQIGEAQLHEMVRSWNVVDAFQAHIPFAEKAIERYIAEDYLSAISNLWPRIEGALRYLYTGPHQKPGTKILLANVRDVLERKAVAPASYLPGLFESYLFHYYFRDFNLSEDRIELGRHHAHGVTKAGDYDRPRALQGFLILDQLACYAKLGWAERERADLL
jgi:hypothetical protein